MKQPVIDQIIAEKVVAIVRGYSIEQCIRLARALHEGGVNMLEVTFPQTNKEEMLFTSRTIEALRNELGDCMEFGAGTVTSPEMVDMAQSAGATFIISPNTDGKVIDRTLQKGLVSIPGAFTPTEIKTAYDLGADIVKVFPANMFGPSYFKTVHAPLSQVRLMAVGGVTEKDINAYLAAGACSAGVAGCLFNAKKIENGLWQEITEAARNLRDVISKG